MEENDTGIPYWITNEDWYYYDEKEEIYKLTEQAPPKAIESYYEFYNEEDDN